VSLVLALAAVLGGSARGIHRSPPEEVGRWTAVASVAVPAPALAPAFDERSTDADRWVDEGLRRLAAGALDPAIRAFSRAIELDPGHSIAWRGRGDAWLAEGKPGRALESFERACTLDPACEPAFVGCGIARRELGDRDGALAALDRAVRLDVRHRDPEAWLERGLTRQLVGDTAGASLDLLQAYEIGPAAARAEKRADLEPARRAIPGPR
jgi:tetratricopeptide (TPR) repeat protein